MRAGHSGCRLGRGLRAPWGLRTAAVGAALVFTLPACGGADGGPRDRSAQMRAAADGPELPPLDGKVDDELRLQLAELLVKEGAQANALPIVRDALARNPTDARLHYLLGTMLRDRGVYAEAEKSLRQAVELGPKLAPAHSALGILLDLQKRSAEAEKHHREALRLDETPARYHNNLGFCLALQGRPAEAIPAYEGALRRAPTAAQVYNNLGFAYAAVGRDADALRMFRQAGGEAAALANLALAHELQGKPDQARALYQRALTEDPRQAAALANLEALDAERRPPAAAPSVAPPETKP